MQISIKTLERAKEALQYRIRKVSEALTEESGTTIARLLQEGRDNDQRALEEIELVVSISQNPPPGPEAGASPEGAAPSPQLGSENQ